MKQWTLKQREVQKEPVWIGVVEFAEDLLLYLVAIVGIDMLNQAIPGMNVVTFICFGGCLWITSIPLIPQTWEDQDV